MLRSVAAAASLVFRQHRHHSSRKNDQLADPNSGRKQHRVYPEQNYSAGEPVDGLGREEEPDQERTFPGLKI